MPVSLDCRKAASLASVAGVAKTAIRHVANIFVLALVSQLCDVADWFVLRTISRVQTTRLQLDLLTAKSTPESVVLRVARVRMHCSIPAILLHPGSAR